MGGVLRPLQGKVILIVEDNFLVAEDLRRLIEEAGGIVRGPVPTPTEALGLAEADALDGALLDVELRNGTCVAVAQALQRRHVPFVVVSGYDRIDLSPPLRDAPYMGKPVQTADLVAVVARAFTGRVTPR
jgi:two-component SAPR family response regulator